MEYVKQTGLRIKAPSPDDYIAGGISGIPIEERLLLGDWEEFFPSFEKQYRNGFFFTFDTLSCVTFAALNIIEMQVNYLVKKETFDAASLQYLKDAGYFDENGKFNCSDKFTAIMSGTTDEGNYFYKVWDSIRKDGILPEKDLPIGDSKSFAEYHNPAQITPEMKEKAKKILEILNFKYEWVYFDDNKKMNPEEKEAMEKHLTQSPLEIAIPVPGTHAITLTDIDGHKFKAFDHYEPFIREWQDGEIDIHFALKGYVSPKLKKNAFRYTFKNDLSLGRIHSDVIFLQKVLNNNTDTQVAETGNGSPGKETNFFGPVTKKAVIAFQLKYRIMPAEGYVGPKTRAKLNELYGNGEIVETTPKVSKIDLFAQAIKTHEGYFVGSRSYRNKSPANFKQRILSNYMRGLGAIALDPQGFVIFPTIEIGERALRTFLTDACAGRLTSYTPVMTLLEFFAGIEGSDRFTGYAPAHDNNVPERYAKDVARKMGVDITTPIHTFI